MTTTYREMVAGAALASTPGAVYSCPASTSASIQAVTVSNPTAAPVVVSLWRVPAGGAAGVNQLIAQAPVPAGGVRTLFDAINHKLEAGSQLYAQGAGCGLNVSGVEYIKDN